MHSFTLRLVLLLLLFPLLALAPRPATAEAPSVAAAPSASDDEDTKDAQPDAGGDDLLAQGAPPPTDVNKDRLLDAAQKGRPDEPPKAPAIDYYVKPRGYRIIPETDPPRYVRNAAKTGFELLEDLDWLDLGLENRTRFEYRQNSFLRTPQEGWEYPFLLRTRLYVGVHDIIDPFRFAFEFQDSRWENSNYPNTNREVNEREPIQMYGEFHWKDALGDDKPVYIRGGRMAFELLDRRLVANNEFRNTSNNA